MPNGISKDTFEDMSNASKLNVLFDMANDDIERRQCQIEACQGKFDKLNKRKWIDKGMATASGFGGGFFAVIVVSLKKAFL